MIANKLYRRWLMLFILPAGLFATKPVFALTVISNQIILAVQAQHGQAKGDEKRSFSGNISWYGKSFQGKRTASGEIFDMNKLTAAHLKLPFGTRVLIEDPKTGKSTIVKVNDRGPYVKTRVMDITKAAAKQLGILRSGVIYVDCLVLRH